MKIRSDYVTNSSSSSFVIAYRSLPEFDEETISKYPFLKNYTNLIERVLFTTGEYSTSAGEVFSTKEEWDEYFIDNFGYGDINTVEKILEDDESLEDEYYEVVKALENGFKILDKSVDYSDSYCECMIRELANDKENFVILREIN